MRNKVGFDTLKSGFMTFNLDISEFGYQLNYTFLVRLSWERRVGMDKVKYFYTCIFQKCRFLTLLVKEKYHDKI